MPYKSAKQRAYLHAVHPDIAARWDAEYGGKVDKNGKAKRKSQTGKRRQVRRRG